MDKYPLFNYDIHHGIYIPIRGTQGVVELIDVFCRDEHEEEDMPFYDIALVQFQNGDQIELPAYLLVGYYNFESKLVRLLPGEEAPYFEIINTQDQSGPFHFISWTMHHNVARFKNSNGDIKMLPLEAIKGLVSNDDFGTVAESDSHIDIPFIFPFCNLPPRYRDWSIYAKTIG